MTRRRTSCCRCCPCCEEPEVPNRPKITNLALTRRSSMAVFNVSVSPVRPVDNVLERRLFVSPKAGTGPEYVVVVDPDINGIEGELSDDQVPASCYLIDVNKTGPSAASPSFPLVPELPPTPFESVPATPAILGVTWGTNPSVRTPAPACSRKASQAPIVFDRRACAKC